MNWTNLNSNSCNLYLCDFSTVLAISAISPSTIWLRAAGRNAGHSAGSRSGSCCGWRSVLLALRPAWSRGCCCVAALCHNHIIILLRLAAASRCRRSCRSASWASGNELVAAGCSSTDGQVCFQMPLFLSEGSLPLYMLQLVLWKIAWVGWRCCMCLWGLRESHQLSLGVVCFVPGLVCKC